MSADWEEVKRLAADFQRAQLSSTVQKLSERNCIEIVKKLIESKLVEVIFTTDGKEYLTPNRVLKEIKDELVVHGGRIDLVELAQIIGIDYSHVESRASEFVSFEPNTSLVLGQLINSEYLDQVAEEVNEKLHQIGELSVAELTKLYDLPGDYLERALEKRLGTIIQGQIDKDSRTFFTESYIAQHTARIKGALSALTRPVPLTSLINHFKFPEKLCYRVADELVKTGRLAGSLSGGRSERAIYIPDIYAKSQNEWVDSFYLQNGYLEYDALSRLGILDPKAFIKKKFKDEQLTYLTTCCVGQNILNQLEATVEDALNTGGWVDVLPVLPSVLTQEDCHSLITIVTKSIAKQGSTVHIFCDTVVMSDAFLKSCQETFDTLMQTKAAEDVTKSPHLFSVQQQSAKAAATKKDKETPGKGKQDRKEDRKKRASAGKSGGGTQGRETKTKTTKKKYLANKEVEESDEDEDPPSKSSSGPNFQFMTVDEIEAQLKKLISLGDATDELISEVASQLYRPLSQKYCEVAKALYESTAAASGSSRRKQHADLQEKFTMLLSHIILFEKALKLFADMTSMEEASTQLHKHLLKTLCTDMTNSIVIYLIQEHGISSDSASETMSSEVRQKVISKFSDDDIKQPLQKLHNSLNAKSLEDFHSAVDVALGGGVCDMIIRKPDKKKEKSILANHRQSLLSQLSEATDPALCLHLAVLVIFQAHTHNMLHASGKFVPHVVGYLQRHLHSDVYQLLTTYQELVIKKLTPTDDEETRKKNECVLEELMPKIKEAAVTYKKTSISESEC